MLSNWLAAVPIMEEAAFYDIVYRLLLHFQHSSHSLQVPCYGLRGRAVGSVLRTVFLGKLLALSVALAHLNMVLKYFV